MKMDLVASITPHILSTLPPFFSAAVRCTDKLGYPSILAFRSYECENAILLAGYLGLLLETCALCGLALSSR